jgi:hypothetical protein
MRSTRFLAALVVSAIVLNGILRADLPPGWEHVDVGVPPGLPGEASYDDTTEVYSVTGNGQTELWMPSADTLHLAFKISSGDCEIIARIQSIEDVNDWSKAGVMIRATLDPDAPCALMGLTSTGRTLFQHRKELSEGLWSQHSPRPGAVDLPCWVRLIRERNVFTGYYSSDGENWIEQPNPWIAVPDADNPAKIAMGNDVFIGLFVTSQDASARCTAQFDHVRVITPAGTAMTYRGYLVDQGMPMNGLYDLRFTLYDSPAGGYQVGDTYDANELDIVEGHVTATVFFGGGPDVFNGEARWLEVAVRPSGPADVYRVLEPRERITPAPYAVYASKPIGPKGDQGPPGPKGDMPDHEWQKQRAYLRFQKPDGTWGEWVFVGGPPGPLGPVPDHQWDPKTGCLQFETPDHKWGPCINVGDLSVNFADTDWTIDGQNIYRMSGLVGILTNRPARPLDVAGEAGFGRGLFARDATGIGFKDDGGALGLWVEEGGNVGVRTKDPKEELDVNGQGRFDGALYAADTDGIGFLDRNGALGLWVEEGGNVGVRTKDPKEELDVNGQGRFDGALYAADTDGIGFLDRGGALGLWVEDGGNVGVGTRTPEAKLAILGNKVIAANSDGVVEVRCTPTSARLTLGGGEIQARTGNQYQAATLSVNGFGGDVLLVTRGGRVGIGTVGPKIDVAIGGSDTGLNSDSDGQLDILSKNKKAVSIRPAGVGIGVDNPQESLHVNGTARLKLAVGAKSPTPVVADPDGKLWRESSSRRYKTNVRDLEPDSDAILRLHPVRFQWKTTGEEEIGLIAEEVAEAANDLVTYDAEGRPEGVKYSKLSLCLLSVVRAQHRRIEELEQRVRKYESLDQRVASLEHAACGKAGAAKGSNRNP